jgi:hypothetical protein
MKARYILMVVVLVATLALAACNKAEPTPEPLLVPEGEVTGPRGSLQGITGLALGTLKLEGTEYAVTPEQAAAMLPLWRAVQGGTLQGAAETEAVLKQIEGVLDEDQLAAIDGMELTFRDIGAWMEEQGIEMPAPPGGREGGQGGGGAFADMTEEERNRFRQEMQNMTPEQRATRLAEMGIELPEGGVQGGRPGGGVGGFGVRGGGNVLLDPLVELLGERAGE